MRKAKVNKTKAHEHYHISYDELLENYLPKIQSAAQAIGALQNFAITVEDLILAGVRGFKEAFMQLKHQSHDDVHDHCLNQIRHSMLQLITVNR